MKVFIPIALTILSMASAMDENVIIDELGTRRAKICSSQGSPRGKRQAIQANNGEGERIQYRWYVADESTPDGDACEKQEGNHNAIRKPIVAPYGTVTMCVKFDAASVWFRTLGATGHCNPDGKCCDWFPPVKCNERDEIPKWFKLPNGFNSCQDVSDRADRARIAVEYLSDAKGPQERHTICVQQSEEDGGEFIEVPVITTFCVNECCGFRPL